RISEGWRARACEWSTFSPVTSSIRCSSHMQCPRRLYSSDQNTILYSDAMLIDTEFNSAAQVPARICVDAAVLAEERGFGCVCKGAPNSGDPFVLLSAYAACTSRVDLGTAIYHVFGRSPVTLGIQAATLNEYAEGRLILGIGVANQTIAAWHGQRYERPL